MRHRIIMAWAAGIALAVAGGVIMAQDDNLPGAQRLTAALRGFDEPPSVSSTGRGVFTATISQDGTSIQYKLSYQDLEGDVQQAHIHLGQRGVNGAIAVFLCSNLGNGPAGTQACPGPRAGEVSGTITAESIIGPAAQGLAPGEFEELLRAALRDVTYANVHTVKHPGGEIRGQIGFGFAQR
ncbi:MAG TPA: CHRD domain-containing protein [Candidatus Polarisedimenticolia bacterium]|nr:CHRD domain-containing protein [Candidatus Polarisedimenticolia bacterium]